MPSLDQDEVKAATDSANAAALKAAAESANDDMEVIATSSTGFQLVHNGRGWHDILSPIGEVIVNNIRGRKAAEDAWEKLDKTTAAAMAGQTPKAEPAPSAEPAQPTYPFGKPPADTQLQNGASAYVLYVSAKKETNAFKVLLKGQWMKSRWDARREHLVWKIPSELEEWMDIHDLVQSGRIVKITE